MKKLILLFCICALLSCKKNSATRSNEDIIDVKWVLETAVLDRPLPISSGGVTTDYIAINGSQSCIGSGNTLTYTLANTPGVAYWAILYTFKAKLK